MLDFIRTLVYKIPMSPALQESLLEILRLAVIAFVSVIITGLLNVVKTLPNPEIWVLVLTVIGRAWDKYTYTVNKENKVKGVDNNGLIGF